MTTTPVRVRALLVVASALTLAATAARGDEPLRWKFNKGQALHYTLTQKVRSKSEVSGKTFEVLQNQETDMSWKVTGVDASGNAEMDQTMDRILLTVSGPGNDTKFDTKTEPAGEEPPAAKMLRGLVGSPIHMKMSARGDISGVTVPPKILDAFKSLGPAGGGGAMFSEDWIKKTTSQATIVLPEGPLVKGDTWKSNKSQPWPFGTIVLDTTYTFEGLTGADDRIGMVVNADIKAPPEGPTTIKMLSSDGKGGVRFDPKAGVLRGSELNLKMTMQITVNGQAIKADVDTITHMDEKGEGSK
ncbi:MAG: DUF6263 family protein [Isosphaeraceae bacterium]